MENSGKGAVSLGEVEIGSDVKAGLGFEEDLFDAVAIAFENACHLWIE